MTDREAFEAWVSGPPYECEVTRFPEGSAWPGNYRAASVDLAWFAWQAATAATQERCAKVCREWADAHAKDTGICTYGNCDFVAAAMDCADAIRKGE